jgi:hypothetical protein
MRRDEAATSGALMQEVHSLECRTRLQRNMKPELKPHIGLK